MICRYLNFQSTASIETLNRIAKSYSVLPTLEPANLKTAFDGIKISEANKLASFSKGSSKFPLKSS